MQNTNIAQVEGQSNDVETVTTTSPELTPEQMHNMMVWMKAAKQTYGAQCRKPGHVHRTRNPAGAKLERKLARQGSLYGRLSLISQMMVDIQERKFKETKEKLVCQK